MPVNSFKPPNSNSQYVRFPMRQYSLFSGNLVYSILLTEFTRTSIVEIKASLVKNSTLLDDIVDGTTSLRESFSGPNVFGDKFSVLGGSLLSESDFKSSNSNVNQTFEFDDILVSSETYPR